MGFLKVTTYLYLLFAVFFIYRGIVSFSEEGGGAPYVNFAFAALAVFMFFFRKKNLKKFDNKKQE
ncbi:hypothetical protein [Flavobacterium beibuense]|uniref:Uncharacterized protein n=1 Tax=Flavobacterium beibuense TaxID=657326 RepID=A0A444WC33_9FLAO|nr:hypothetical protein [Flavobacterium beibuense]RYJ43375.1 hypothetical protein NU09_1713 [Flavobacterium beibuense]